jgi:hypothetical protein
MIFEMLCKKTDYYTASIIYEYYMTDKYKEVKYNYSKLRTQLKRVTSQIRKRLNKEKDDLAQIHPHYEYNKYHSRRLPTFKVTTMWKITYHAIKKRDITRIDWIIKYKEIAREKLN